MDVKKLLKEYETSRVEHNNVTSRTYDLITRRINQMISYHDKTLKQKINELHGTKTCKFTKIDDELYVPYDYEIRQLYLRINNDDIIIEIITMPDDYICFYEKTFSYSFPIEVIEQNTYGWFDDKIEKYLTIYKNEMM